MTANSTGTPRVDAATGEHSTFFGVQFVNADFARTLERECEALRADAERYRWLRDLKCNQFYLTRDTDHATNYTTAKEWMEKMMPEWFVDDDPTELQKMKDTNTIWSLQIYPKTPIGFNKWNAATLDALIDAALKRATP